MEVTAIYVHDTTDAQQDIVTVPGYLEPEEARKAAWAVIEAKYSDEILEGTVTYTLETFEEDIQWFHTHLSIDSDGYGGWEPSGS